jgi:hypothetical protein
VFYSLPLQFLCFNSQQIVPLYEKTQISEKKTQAQSQKLDTISVKMDYLELEVELEVELMGTLVQSSNI